jgi:hypothetical protein
VSPPASLPFDSIELRDGDERRVIGVGSFLEIPLTERVRLLLEKRVRFLRRGAEVDVKVALAAIYDTRRRS